MLRSHLLDSLKQYLDQEASLQGLGERLLSHLQEILDSGDQDTIRLANQVDADLVEFNEGLIDESILRERLERYLASNASPSEYSTHAYSESDVVFSPIGVPGAEVTIHFRHVVVA
ncbi:MAG: hypothetical protein HYZ91_05620 [Candidatus Omnitrophica bacterium]|nr:hypothetical protein [Candidatus Omnitrophota bacterium]